MKEKNSSTEVRYLEAIFIELIFAQHRETINVVTPVQILILHITDRPYIYESGLRNQECKMLRIPVLDNQEIPCRRSNIWVFFTFTNKSSMTPHNSEGYDFIPATHILSTSVFPWKSICLLRFLKLNMSLSDVQGSGQHFINPYNKDTIFKSSRHAHPLVKDTSFSFLAWKCEL